MLYAYSASIHSHIMPFICPYATKNTFLFCQTPNFLPLKLKQSFEVLSVLSVRLRLFHRLKSLEYFVSIVNSGCSETMSDTYGIKLLQRKAVLGPVASLAKGSLVESDQKICTTSQHLNIFFLFKSKRYQYKKIKS